MHNKLSNIGFIMVHARNQGHITSYTDIEFQLRKIETQHYQW